MSTEEDSKIPLPDGDGGSVRLALPKWLKLGGPGMNHFDQN